MCFYYDDTCDISETNIVKTRKAHKCEGCHTIIPKGQMVTVCSGLFDHAWFRYYVCEDCQRKIYSLAAEELEHGCSWHESWCSPLDLKEHLEERNAAWNPLELLNGTLAQCLEQVNAIHEKKRHSITKEVNGYTRR